MIYILRNIFEYYFELFHLIIDASIYNFIKSINLYEYLAITPVVRRTVNDEKLTILSIEDNEAKQLSVDDDIIEKYDSVLIRNSLEQILLTAGNISYEELELLQLRYGLFDVDSKNIATIKNSTGKYWRSQDAMLTIIFKKLRNNEGIITLFKHLKS